MKIHNLENIKYSNQIFIFNDLKTTNPVINKVPYAEFYKQAYYHPVSFKRLEKEITQKSFDLAQKYVNKIHKQIKDPIFSSFDSDKLEGIQYGIEVFKGLSINQIKLLTSNLNEFLIMRGCSHRCSSCAANAVPQHFKKDSNIISSMTKEDFDSFVDGISELNQRLGINTLESYILSVKKLFHDGDCMEIEMKDKNGNIYDFMDTTQLLQSKLKLKGYFDSVGWNPKSEKYQRRAEKFIKYFKENNKQFDQIAISVNPFDGILEKANLYKKEGNVKKALEYKNIYTDRIANAIFTFTPVIKENNFGFLTRMKSNNPLYDKHMLYSLISDIVRKLENLYNQDLLSKQHHIKEQSQIDNNMKIIIKKINENFEDIGKIGRAKELFASGEEDMTPFGQITKERDLLTKVIDDNKLNLCVDSNGKVYISNYNFFLPTNIQLNFSTKNKNTIPLGEHVSKTSELFIKNHWKELFD